MKEVIRIQDEKVQDEKPVEFTHYLHGNDGWQSSFHFLPNIFDKIVYLGECAEDGDIFAAYLNGAINIYKGHLNSGKY